MSSRYPQLTEDFLRHNYATLGRSMGDIAKEIGCTKSRVSQLVRQFGIPKGKTDPYIGKRCGSLLVREKVGTYRKAARYLCDCDCGGTIVARGYSLKRNTTSCGCKRKRVGKNCPRFQGHEGISGTLWGRFVTNAVSRNIEFAITPEYAWNLFLRQGGRCAYTNMVITLPADSLSCRNGGSTASLDRIDSKKAYVEGNLQWVHKLINRMKSSMSDEEFVGMCEMVVGTRKKQSAS